MTDWAKEVDAFLAEEARSRHQRDAGEEEYRLHVDAFLTETVLPAFAQLKANLEQPGRDRCVDIQHVSTTRVQLTIGRVPPPDQDGGPIAELQYTIELAIDPLTAHAVKIIDEGDGPKPEMVPNGSSDHANQTLIINDVLRYWQEAVRKQGAAR